MPSDDFWADLPKKAQKKAASAVSKKLTVQPAPVPVEPPLEVTESAVKRLPMRQIAIVGVTLVLMVVAAGIGGAFALWQGTSFAVADDETADPIVVEIVRGRSTRQIAGDLEDAQVIVSRWPFLFTMALSGGVVRAGSYSISPSASIAEIVAQLTEGETSAHRVTIPEGWRIEQIAEYLSSLAIVSYDDFMAASVYDSVRYTLPTGITREAGETLEGLLFPDTYEFRIGVTSKEIVQTLLTTFAEKTRDIAPTYEQVILASIVEREASRDTDRAQIAGVYANRLKINMKLDADPTVQYANDNARAAVATDDEFSWWVPITVADYQGVKSPWNTYLVAGLPPTPIANPGLAALEAAVNPATHDYYYFLHTDDGTSVYSKTKEEHDRAKANL